MKDRVLGWRIAKKLQRYMAVKYGPPPNWVKEVRFISRSQKTKQSGLPVLRQYIFLPEDKYSSGYKQYRVYG